MDLAEPIMLFYFVQNQDGQYFRRKGYGGAGDSWTDDIEKGRAYTKIGQARSVVTWFAERYPEYDVPKIAIFEAKRIDTIDETVRVRVVKAKKERAALNKEERKAQQEAVEANERVQAVRRRREACQPDSGRS